MYPAESFAYQLGEVLCFIIAPALLISGIAVCIVAPHQRKEKRIIQVAAAAPRKKPKVYSATRLLLSRIIGAALVIFLVAFPFIAGGVEGWRLFLGMFVIFPFPLMTLPCLAMALYLAFHKTPRAVDIPAIIACVILLLALPFGTVIVFFLPFILFSTPFGLVFLIAIAVIVSMRILRGKSIGKRGPRAQVGQRPLVCARCGRDLSKLPEDIALCPYCGEKLLQRTCLGCGRDLSQLPTDIRDCPYCGRAVSILGAKAEAIPEVTEPPTNVRRIRRYTRTTALLGLLIAVASLIIGPFLGGFPRIYLGKHLPYHSLSNVRFVTFLAACRLAKHPSQTLFSKGTPTSVSSSRIPMDIV
jgi:DNA-directed RNA polymerase subunit RPC12/RpoP